MKNKKKTIYLIALLLITTMLFAGCSDNKKPENQNVDYSQYSFINTSWTRDAEHDTETIRFGEDGSFTYYCGCGNPVNDSDLCESYTYNDETKEIKFECFETTEEMVTNIKIVENPESFEGALRDAGLDNIDMYATDDKGKPLYGINTVTSAIKQIPSLVKEVVEAEKLVFKEIEEAGRARGGNNKKLMEDGITL